MGDSSGYLVEGTAGLHVGEIPQRKDEREITVFKSLGLAVEDIFAAHLVLTRAA